MRSLPATPCRHHQRDSVLGTPRRRYNRSRCCRLPGIAGRSGRRSQDAWSTSSRGLAPSDLAMNVVLPELDGRLFTRAISFKSEKEADDDLEHASLLHEPAPDRIAFVAKLAAAWTRLGTKPRGSGASRSCSRTIPHALVAPAMLAGSTRRKACARSSVCSPMRGIRPLEPCGPPARSSDGSPMHVLAKRSGYPSNSIGPGSPHYPTPPPTRSSPLGATRRMTRPASTGDFRFPCLRAGHVTVLLQPDRGSHADRKQGYHDTACPPRHAYVALYALLRESERIDALVHLGTHGTLEWLPGKALALSQDCFPEALLGPLPVVYPFIVNNPGEAVQAKRRISAVTIGHMTPPLRSGLHGPLAELEGPDRGICRGDGVDRRRGPLLEAEILERAWRSGLPPIAASSGMILRGPPSPNSTRNFATSRICHSRQPARVRRSPAAEARAELLQATSKVSPAPHRRR